MLVSFDDLPLVSIIVRLAWERWSLSWLVLSGDRTTKRKKDTLIQDTNERRRRVAAVNNHAQRQESSGEVSSELFFSGIIHERAWLKAKIVRDPP